MRELWRTGYMHNRVRMIVASFLAKHLMIDWRSGEEWFWDTLCDADPASNPRTGNGSPGSGADAAPYFRIFNPVLQGEKFDPDGAYVRRWVPELAKLDALHIHKPWEAPDEALRKAGVALGKTYPGPIVDHARRPRAGAGGVQRDAGEGKLEPRRVRRGDPFGLTAPRSAVGKGGSLRKGQGMARVALIDNYDSFTFNLVHYLGELGADVSVWRNDEIGVGDVLEARPDAIVLSPGPCTPNEAGICLDLVRAASDTTPILGVCLGHQAIGQAFGGEVVRAPQPLHGKTSRISHNAKGLFRGLNGPFEATRYHSLIIDRATRPEALEVSAETDDGLIMAVEHREKPVFGVQFHPESIASEHGRDILRNFLELAAAFGTRDDAR